uniref:Uncharacterized protein LOC104247938 n=1 Tax=Nicotiana sylvestris TaxID=4096 RepID=A0A1U7YK95_NICSY|nr:PREDICTED: uncharacterized protein LOC104247938 [Nicotiana sylvestris]
MVQKSPGVLELDVVSTLSAQVSALTNQVNQMTMINNKQQAQLVQQVQIYCEVCEECHMSNLCPANPEFVNFMVNAVTLRNGRALEEVPKKKKNTAHPEGELVPKPIEENEKDDKGPEPVIETRLPPPFPQRLQKQKDDAKYKKFLDILSQVTVNLPLVEFCRKCLSMQEFETVALTEECNSRVQSKLPLKLKDLGSFIIPLSLGKQEVGRALCDLGASINLMSSSLFKQLGLAVLRSTTITLQLADRSLVMPEGIIEYVLVRVGKFILPADFIVLDYEVDEEVPIILGRPFLATGGAIIDVREGKLKMRVDDDEVTFNVYNALKFPKHYEDLCMITVVKLKGIEQSQ